MFAALALILGRSALTVEHHEARHQLPGQIPSLCEGI
jgi:hypothetical protein